MSNTYTGSTYINPSNLKEFQFDYLKRLSENISEAVELS